MIQVCMVSLMGKGRLCDGSHDALRPHPCRGGEAREPRGLWTCCCWHVVGFLALLSHCLARVFDRAVGCLVVVLGSCPSASWCFGR